MAIRLQPLDPRGADRSAVTDLWRRSLGEVWPLEPAWHDSLGSAGVGAVDGRGVVVGFATVGARSALTSLVVDSAHRRHGIGRSLHDAALDLLPADGELGIGSGTGEDYVFPGVPENLPGASEFFHACGWRWDYVAADLVQRVGTYATPDGVAARAEGAGVEFRVLDDDRADVLAFVDRYHHGWLDYYAEVDVRRILVGERAGEVVASLVFTLPEHVRNKWAALLGDGTGDLGCVGVRPDVEGQGIGTALVALGTEILQARGVTASWLQWTTRLSFYGYLGYRPWRTFLMSRMARDQLRH